SNPVEIAMRGLLILLSSAALAAAAEIPDACATIDCNSGLVCAMHLPQSCRVSPCPRMPGCLPQNQTCQANSCAADETCVLRQVTCITAPCYPVRKCVKYPKCAANEEYNECSLSGPCEPNCKDSYPICTNADCGKGACECKAGYYRHNGKCITHDKCPTPTCDKPNEVWNTCPSACTRSCRIVRGKEEQMMCPAVCGTPQCTCAVGFVRDDDFNCVKEADCPTEFKCDSPHEEFQKCSTNCEPTCDNRSPACVESCGPAKCQCKPNYVRHEGHCLFALQCPLEGNSTTISPVKHHRHHKNSDDDSNDDSNERVKPTKRPSKRQQHSKEDSNDYSNEQDEHPCNAVRCAADTVCSLKNGVAVCAKCAKNETIDPCPNPCSEPSCDQTYEAFNCRMMKMCMPQACRCAKGFVRNMKTGQCVVKSECPTGANVTVQILPMPDDALLFNPFNGTKLTMPMIQNGTMNILPFIPGTKEAKPMVRPFYNGTHVPRPLVQILPYPDFNGTIPDGVQISPPFHGKNGTNIPKPLIQPFFPSNETMHIMPVGLYDNMLVDPIPGTNGTKLTMPMVRPFFPGTNGTKPLIRPYFPSGTNGTFHIMPAIEDNMLIDPIFTVGNYTKPMVRPFFPPSNGTNPMILPYVPGTNGAKPAIRPFFPDNNGSMHIMPYNGTDIGIIQISPPFSGKNGTKTPKPLVRPFFPSNETMHIMPIGLDDNMLVDPIPAKNGTKQTTPMVRPFLPGTNGSANGYVHIMPFLPATGWAKPLIRPMFPDNGTMHTMPFNGTDAGAVHIMPAIFPGKNGTGGVQILPIMHANETFGNVCAKHKCPAGSRCEEAQVRCFASPCIPVVATCVKGSKSNGTMHIMPFNGTDSGAVHIMPVFPGKNGTGGVQILPYIPNEKTICANHTCPAGTWCEPKDVQCLVPPCTPIPTCVSESGEVSEEDYEVDPIVCGKHEEYSECAPRCEETCRGVHDCVETMVCTPGCVCEDRFKRDENGICVPNNKCWKTAGCLEHEHWHKCHSCEPTCDDVNEDCTVECSSGCSCDEGYVRGPFGFCIEQSKCPKPNGNSTRV
ncbi:hypothetical protein PFISCL1PPCAC_342, partial [Pristionchus fissidentatus]